MIHTKVFWLTISVFGASSYNYTLKMVINHTI